MSMCDYCRHHDCNQPQWHIKAVLNNDMYCQAFKAWLKRNISMANVTSSFCAQEKDITRRNWADVTINLHKKGTKSLVWNKQARFGGEPIGVLELTENPYKQPTGDMTFAQYEFEGFNYLDTRYHEITKKGFPLDEIFQNWRRQDITLTVVPFKILEVFPGMKSKYTTDKEIIRCVKALVKAIA